MSAQPDPALEGVVTEPLRLALWRLRHKTRKPEVITAIAETFVTEARGRGGQDFDLPKAFRVIGAVTATRFTLAVLPRWVAESLAVALDLDPSVLRPEGSAPAPLRPVPSLGTCCVSHGADRTGAGEESTGPAAGLASPGPRPDLKEVDAVAGKRHPCRKLGCDGGSDKNEIGRDQHEVLAHGVLFGLRAPHPPALPRKPLPDDYPCPWCPVRFASGTDLIDHLRSHATTGEAPPPELVLAETGAFLNVSVASILSPSRVKKTTFARQVAMYFLRDLCGMTVEAAGEFIGRDHTTVTHAEQRIRALVATAGPEGIRVEILRTRIRETYDRGRRFRAKAAVPPVDGPEWEMPVAARVIP